MTLEEFTEEAIRDSALRALAARVETCIDPAKDALPMLYPPMDVRIETTDGRVIEGCEPFVKSHPKNPFTLDDCIERFMVAAAASVRPLVRKRLERFVSLVEHLEDVTDTGEMAPLLA